MFRTELDLRAVHAEPGIFLVLAPLVWDVGDGTCLTVPALTRTDLASIPQALKNLPFLDVCGLSRRPAVLHDYLYNCGKALVPSRAAADAVLRDALLAEGASWWVAQCFYRGVRAFGWIPYRRSPV